jgi:hypothetical protein
MSTATYALHSLIKEARRRALRRRWAYAGVVALVAGVGIWGGLALTGGSGAVPAPPAPPGYHLVKARGDVEHALLASPYSVEVNGHRVGNVARTEVWVDRKAGLVRMRGLKPGNPAVGLPPGFPSDETSRCVPSCAFFVALLEPYWPVDTTRFVRRPGLGTFHGRRVIWLGKLENSFAPAYRNGEWIALDPRTHDAIGQRMYGESFKPTGGQVVFESWVVKRFADIPSNRFWFPVRDKPLDVRFTRLQPVPLYVPGHAPVTDLRDTSRIVVGRLARATIFAATKPDGSWRFFSASEDGRVNGHSRADDPHTLRAGLVQVGQGSLFSRRAYLIVAGSMFARHGTKLFAVFADGNRRRLELIPSGRPTGPTAFHYYLIPPLRYARGRQTTGFVIVRGARVVARDDAFVGYQAPQQPAPGPLQAALRVFESPGA